MDIRRLIFAAILTPALLPAQGEHWVATWGTSQQLYRAAPPAGRGTPPVALVPPPATPAPAPPTTGPRRRFPVPVPVRNINNQTVRMLTRVSIGGRSVRIRLASALGSGTVTLGAAHIALHAKDSAIVPGSDRVLTFSGKPGARLYAGETLISDPVSLNVPALGDLAVSLYFPGETGAPTNHLFALRPTYLSAEGDFTGKDEIPGATASESYYWLAGIDVLAPADAFTLVTFGDSITDGDQSSPDLEGAWPTILARRLQANKATAHVGVVNAGISGNRVLGDGQSALVRLYHDVLSQPGIRWMTLLEGINDITGGTRPNSNPKLTPEDLISAYRQIIELAHLHGVKVIGCTLTPFRGSPNFNEDGEAIRDAVNRFIRSGAFDAVMDFDAATRDSAEPQRFRVEADSPDLLHPGDAGYKLMGESFNLSIFRKK